MLFKSRTVHHYSSPASTAALQGAFQGLETSTGLRRWLPMVGPAMIASVGYMDPGNFATNLQAGSTYGYQLLWVVLVANLIAMLFQSMAANLGIVTGRSLAQLCKEEFPRPVAMGMWIASEIAAMATDLAEFMGAAMGISLLLHLAMGWGLVITGVVTAAILTLDRQGFRPLEVVIGALVAIIGASFVVEVMLAPMNWHAAIFHTFVPQLHGTQALNLAVAIIGATIMPHTLYLHSGLTHNRVALRNDHERRKMVRFSNREVVVALGVAGLVNMAMVGVFAAVFAHGAPGISDITAAYHALTPVLGAGAATVFLVSLLASGISSSVVGTMAGQSIMQGFTGYKLPVMVRRLITMVPALIIGMAFDPMKAMVQSQVVLSLVLPIPLVALVVLSSRSSVMGAFRPSRKTIVLAVGATVVISLLNVVLVVQSVG